MSVTHLLIQYYLATVLGVAGLIKIVNLPSFIASLHRQGILPKKSIKIMGLLIPLIELGLALFLIIGLLPFWTAVFVMLLFFCFLAFKITMIKMKQIRDCSCFGSADTNSIDAPAITVSFILFISAAFNLWGVIVLPPLPLTWRAVPMLLYTVLSIWLLGKIVNSSCYCSRTRRLKP